MTVFSKISACSLGLMSARREYQSIFLRHCWKEIFASLLNFHLCRVISRVFRFRIRARNWKAKWSHFSAGAEIDWSWSNGVDTGRKARSSVLLTRVGKLIIYLTKNSREASSRAWPWAVDAVRWAQSISGTLKSPRMMRRRMISWDRDRMCSIKLTVVARTELGGL